MRIGILCTLILTTLITRGQPIIPSTPFTRSFMTNRTAAQARTYLGVSSGGGTSGTIINSGTPSIGAVPAYSDTTGTNVAPGTLILTGTNASISGVLSAFSINVTNSITAPELDVGTLVLTNKLTRSIVTNGIPNQIVINDGAGMLSSEATLGATRFPALTGAITTPGGSLNTTLSPTGTAGTYTKVTFNAQGLETSGTSAILASSDFVNQGTVSTVLHGNAAGNPSFGAVALGTDVSGTLAAAQFPALTGDVTTSAGSLAATIAAKSVTYNKIQDIAATQRVLGRNSAGAGSAEELTISQFLDWLGSAAQGDIPFRDASGWNRIGAGTSGQFLKTQGAGANPIWATSSGGVTGPGSSTDTAFARWSGTGGTTLQDSSVTWNGATMKLGADAASPIAQTIIASGARGGTDSNVAGAATTIAGSPSTGNANGGSVLIGVSAPGSSGTSTNATVTGLTVAVDAQSTATPATTIAGRLRVANGSQSLPSIVFTSDDDAAGTGFYRVSANKIAVAIDGAADVIMDGNSFQLASGYGFDLGGSSSARLLLDGSGRIQQGFDAAAPTSPQILAAADGSGTDKPGADRQLSGGRGTGTGRGGALIGTTSLTTTTGSSLQSESYRYYYSAKFVDLTESTATLVFNMPLATSKYVVFTFDASTNADDGTDFQDRHDILVVEGNNKAGTFTPSISVVSSTAPTFTGTLTTTWTVVQNGNGIDVKNNAVSSLTQTTLRSKFSIKAIESNDTAVVVPQ